MFIRLATDVHNLNQASKSKLLLLKLDLLLRKGRNKKQKSYPISYYFYFTAF